MDRIWAPWRIQYILGDAPGAANDSCPDECIFCSKPADSDDAANLILERGELCFTVMNLYPYNSGHLMVVPFKHTSDLAELDGETMKEMMTTTSRMVSAIRETMNPQGFNIGMNLGAVAGAGIKDHLHMHVVPRWNGDANFMPVLADTRVINEHIEASYRRLLEYFKKQNV